MTPGSSIKAMTRIVDRTRLVVSGFSCGAMSVRHLDRYRGSSFAGFVPMAGTFWEPIPENCLTGAVALIQRFGSTVKLVYDAVNKVVLMAVF